MKREFLKELGIEDKEIIDKIMAENGSDIERTKNNIATIEEELREAKETISTMTTQLQTLKENSASAEDYKLKFEQLEADIREKEEKSKEQLADKELTAKIEAIFPPDKKFTSDYVRKGLISDIKAKFAEDNTKGLEACFQELTMDKDGIFAPIYTPGQMSGMGDIEPTLENKKIPPLII